MLDNRNRLLTRQKIVLKGACNLFLASQPSHHVFYSGSLLTWLYFFFIMLGIYNIKK